MNAEHPSERSPVNELELRAYGLQRSGNHAILYWIFEQFAGGPVCFLNNVRHGDHDPYHNYKQRVLRGIDPGLDTERIRRTPKRVLAFSYEDDADMMATETDFLASALDPRFEANRERYLLPAKVRRDILIIRDPFNFLASRLKKRDSLSGIKSVEVFMANWKRLAEKALALVDNPREDTIVANYNRWVSDLSYRRELSRRLGGTFSDATMDHVTPFGGGSSFDLSSQRLGPRDIIRNWRKLLDPRRYSRIRFYWARLTAPPARKMRVTERWQALAGDPEFRKPFSDPGILALSESLFGEIPGTREFVGGLDRA